MNARADDADRARSLAAGALALFAVDPAGSGVVLRSPAGPVRESWLAALRERLAPDAPFRRVPPGIPDGRLLGGLDLAATLRAGRPVLEQGLLASADGGVLLLAMAERLPAATAARLAAVLDSGELVLEREGLAARAPARLGVVALDEGEAADERVPPALAERLAFHVELGTLGSRTPDWLLPDGAALAAARARLADVAVGDEIVEALCGAGLALGVESLRGPLLALRAARAAAALAGRTAATAEDAALAVQLVLAPRATRRPAPAAPEPPAPDEDVRDAPPDPPSAEEPPPQDARSPEPERARESPPPDAAPSEESHADGAPPAPPPEALPEMLLQAARAALPAGLLQALAAAEIRARRAHASGRAGGLQRHGLRGRPAGVRRGEPRAGARLNVLETLRAAAPWQRLRRAERAERAERTPASAPRILVRREDFHVTRYRPRAETTTVFVVDASGSAALHRLAEAKGAVELLLADCYVRRDRVAVIAFRGRGAELLLPPTRSLVRAKRSLAELPGGGGTPLACGLEAAYALVEAVQRRGGTPTVVLLSDGRPNVGRDGTPGRARAEEEALAAARRLRLAGVGALVVDTAPRPQPYSQRLAAELRARYLPLPHADAAALSRAARAATPG